MRKQLWNKLTAWLCCVTMLLSMVPAAAVPALAADAVLPTIGEVTAGKYVLTEDFRLTGTLTVEGDVTVDLNGQTLNGTSAPYFTIESGAKLTITDTSGAVGKDWTEATAGTGTVRGIEAANDAMILVNGGEFVLNGGKLTGHTNTGSGFNGYGGAIYTPEADSVVTINGGEIIGNTAYRGGAISTKDTAMAIAVTININGGTIIGNVASCGRGATIYTQTGATLNITGGYIGDGIRDGEHIPGGSGYEDLWIRNSAVTISGNPVITGMDIHNTSTTYIGNLNEGARIVSTSSLTVADDTVAVETVNGRNVYTYAGATPEREVIASGYCGGEGDGTNLTWTLYADGELTITGNGAMEKYSDVADTPWVDYRASIQKLTIGNGVTGTCYALYASCYNLKIVVIGDCLNITSSNTFGGATMLEDIIVDANNPYIMSLDGVLYSKDGKVLICYPMHNPRTDFTVPDGVEKIAEAAFGNSNGRGNYNLTSITLPDTVTVIENWAFANCSKIQTLELGNGLVTMGSGAGFFTKSLESIVFPASFDKWGSRVFWGECGIKSVEFLGNAPSNPGGEIASPAGRGAENVTIYYHEGTTGWLDSEYYDTEAGTWCGHPLVMIPAEEEDNGLPTGGTLDAGKYILTGDVTLTGMLEAVGDVVIDLAGHTITMAEGVDKGYFNVPANSRLTIMDSVGGGKVQFKNTEVGNPGVLISGTFVLEGGELTGWTRVNNGIYGAGGAIFVQPNGSFTMNGGKITNCTATFGSAIRTTSGAGMVSINGGEISGNICTTTYGPVVLANDVALVMTGGVIKNNTAGTNGGAIFAGVESSVVVTGDAEISGNTAIKDGGAIFAAAYSNLTVSGDAKISNNTAFASGGAIYAGGSSIIRVMDNATIVENVASSTNGYGGGIFLNSRATAYIDGGTISDNSAMRGGGISGADTANSDVGIYICGGTIKNNHAVQRGGNLYTYDPAIVGIDGGYIGAATWGEGASVATGLYNAEVRGGQLQISGGTIEQIATNRGSDFSVVDVTGNPVIASFDPNANGINTIGALTPGAKVTTTYADMLTVAEGDNTVLVTNGRLYRYNEPLETYTITVGEVENGTVSVSPTSGTAGTMVVVSATPNAGYVLSKIYVDGVAINGNRFGITRNHKVTAEFAVAEFDLPTSGDVASGEYVLTGDHALTGSLTIRGDVTIDLNGHTLSGAVAPYFTIPSGTKLTIVDGSVSSTGTVEGLTSAANAMIVVTGGEFVLNGGRLTGHINTSTGVSRYGGAICAPVADSIVTINGGEIIGNTAYRGGAISTKDTATAVDVTININGGTIIGNVASCGRGATIYTQTGATLNITGGYIGDGIRDGGHIPGGSGYEDLWIRNSAVTISGNPVITGMDVQGTSSTSIGNLNEGARIVSTSSLTVADDTVAVGTVNGRKVYTYAEERVGLTADMFVAGQTMTLTKDSALAGIISLTTAGTYTLDLNGYTLTGTAAPYFIVGTGVKLIVKDSGTSKTGKIQGITAEDAMVLVNGGEFVLDGGKLTGHINTNTNSTNWGGAIRIADQATSAVTVNAGVITGNMAYRGGAISFTEAAKNYATLTINGGEISGNSVTGSGGANLYAQMGANIVVTGGTIGWGAVNGQNAVNNGDLWIRNANVIVSGGQIEDMYYLSQDLGTYHMTISGDAKIGGLYRAEGDMVTIKNLIEGAEILWINDNGERAEIVDVDATAAKTAGTVAEGVYAGQATITYTCAGETPEREVIASGYCGGEGDGTNLTWTLYEDGELVIAGSGAMGTYYLNGTPWYDVMNQIAAVTIEAGVTQIGTSQVFAYCDALTKFAVSAGNDFYCAVDGVLFSKDETTLVRYPSGRGGSYTIPSGVTTIEKSAFHGSDLTEVTIADTVVTIRYWAFNTCHRLKSVTVPASVTHIEAGAFSVCNQLLNVFVDEENSAYCDVDGVLFSKDKTQLLCLPNERDIDEYIVPDGVTTIGEQAFFYCEQLERITVSAGVTAIDAMAFKGCDNLNGVDFFGDCPSVGTEAFNECGTDLTIYYHEGTTDWLESEHYDAEAGTWCGYPLVMIPAEEEDNGLPTSGTVADGEYVLTGDHALTGGLTISGDVTIDLNGYTLTGAVAPYFTIPSGAKLTIVDSSASGTGTVRGIEAANDAMILVNGGAFVLDGGKLTGHTNTSTSKYGGAIYAPVAGSVVTINGGEISGNTAHRGGAISTKDTGMAVDVTININGGIVSGNATNRAATIYTQTGATVNIAGGKVGYGTINGEDVSGLPGSEDLWIRNTTAEITGGDINGILFNGTVGTYEMIISGSTRIGELYAPHAGIQTVSIGNLTFGARVATSSNNIVKGTGENGEFDETVNVQHRLYRYAGDVESILFVGHSFSGDSVAFLEQLGSFFGREIDAAYLYVGSQTVRNHAQSLVESLRNEDLNGDGVIGDSRFRAGDGLYVCAGFEGYVDIPTVMEGKKWDYVVLQPGIEHIGFEGTYNSDINFLKDYIADVQPEAKVFWNQTWAVDSRAWLLDGTDTGHWIEENPYLTQFGGSQQAMYDAILRNTDKFIAGADARFDFDGWFPIGIAVQTMRENYTDSYLTRDGFHLSYNAGRLIASLTVMKTLYPEIALSDLTVADVAEMFAANIENTLAAAHLQDTFEPTEANVAALLTAVATACGYKDTVPAYGDGTANKGAESSSAVFGNDEFVAVYENVTGIDPSPVRGTDSAGVDGVLKDTYASTGAGKIVIYKDGAAVSEIDELWLENNAGIVLTDRYNKLAAGEAYYIQADPRNPQMTVVNGTLMMTFDVVLYTDDGYVVDGGEYQIASADGVNWTTDVPKMYITVGEVVNGTVTVDPASGVAGTTVIITATPDEGYVLTGIYVDGAAIEGNTFTGTGNHTVTATFAASGMIYLSQAAVESGCATAGGYEYVAYTEQGSALTILTKSEMASGFYEYIVDEDGYYVLTALVGSEMKLNQTLEVIYGTKMITTDIGYYDVGNAIIVDARSEQEIEDSEVGVIESLNDMKNALALDATVVLDALVDNGKQTVSVIFVTGVTTPEQFFVSVVKAANGTINVVPNAGPAGTTVTIIATPDKGYELASILVDGAAIDGNTFKITGKHTVTAIFQAITYRISVGEVANGTVSVNKFGATVGERVTVTATPATGYALKEIRVNGVAIAGTSFNMPAYDVTVTAVFDDALYTVNAVQAENGSISVSKTEGKVGETVTVTATPDAGYELQRIYVDGRSVSRISPYTFKISGNHTVIAIFGEITYDVSVGRVSNGTVRVSPSYGVAGTVITVTATPNVGYELKQIYVDGKAITGNTFTVTGNHVVTADFGALSYNVNVEAAANGTVDVDKTTAKTNEMVYVTATPAANYALKEILVNGVAIKGNSFVMPACDVTVTATFDDAVYSVNVVQAANGTVGVDKTEGKVGQAVTVTAAPAEGYELARILINGIPVSVVSPYTFKISGNHTVTAVFEEIKVTATDVPGTVVYSDGTVASGVTVELLRGGAVEQRVTADHNGAYEFVGVGIGVYTIRATDATGNTDTSSITVERMNNTKLFVSGTTNLVLSQSWTISGTVSEAAVITLLNEKGNVVMTMTASAGAFAMGGIANGNYTIRATAANGSDAKEITVFNANVSGVSLVIPEQSVTIHGMVLVEDRGGSTYAAVGATVTLKNMDGVVVDTATTGADGTYSFANLPVDHYVLAGQIKEQRKDAVHDYLRYYTLTGSGYVTADAAGELEVADLILREGSETRTNVSGKVTAEGGTQDGLIILQDMFGSQLKSEMLDKNGKYEFRDVPDGQYTIVAYTGNDGVGSVEISITNGVVKGNTYFHVEKPDKVKNHEDSFYDRVPYCENAEDAAKYREAIAEEKKQYDSMAKKERNQLSKEYVERLEKLCAWLTECEYDAPEGVSVEQTGLVVSSDELEQGKTVRFELVVEAKDKHEVSGDGVQSEEDHIQHAIEDTAGDREIKAYYDINMYKAVDDGEAQEITNVSKDTNTTGKFRITLPIPEEHRGYTTYSIIHVHNGVPVTLADLDNDPDTITIEVEQFSTFVLTAIDEDIVEPEPDEPDPDEPDPDEPEPITGTINLKSAQVELAEEVYIHIRYTYDGFETLDRDYILANMGLLAWPAEAYPGDAAATYDNCGSVTLGAMVTTDGYYAVKSHGIVSTKLGDELIMRVYLRLPDGTYVYSRATKEYSPQTYAVNTLNNAGAAAKLKQLVTAMLDYGAAAQLFFGYRTDDLANDVTLNSGTLDNYRTAYAESMLMSIIAADANVVGEWTRNKTVCPDIIPALELADRVNYQFSVRFNAEIMSKANSVTMLVWDKAAYENLLNKGGAFSADNATAQVDMKLDATGYYTAMYDKVNSNQIGNTLYVCVIARDSDGVEYNSGIAAYNAHKYASNKINANTDKVLSELCKAMVVYSNRANTYFGI